MVERERFPQREVERLLGAACEWDSAGDLLVAPANHLRHLGADFVDSDVERVEDSGSQSTFVSEHSQQQVLGVEPVVVQLARLVLSQRDHLAGTLGEALRQDVEVGWAADCGLAAGAGKQPYDLVSNGVRVHPKVEQDARSDAVVLAHEAEQHVLGVDVVVAEGERLAQRKLQHLFGAGRERDLAGSDLFTLADDPRHLKVYLLDRDVEGVEGSGSDPIPFAEEAEQDVLSADVVVLEEAGLVLGQDDDLAGSLGETLEHSQECRMSESAGRSGLRPPTRLGSPAMTKAEQRQAAEVLKRVVERIDQREVAAPGWLRERLVGAKLALDPGRGSR
jgi:hypothetical protein